MACNKYPEETVAKILDAALELFLQKGYEHTSIQDIVDHLDGLTKGAIYHHFKNKEEIFDAAFNRAMAPTIARISEVREDASLTGAEQIANLFTVSGTGPQVKLWKRLAPDPDPVKNARLLGMEYANALGAASSEFMQPIIEQGIADGSISCKHPRETAEALNLLANLWLLPLFRKEDSREGFANRLDVIIDVARALGIEFDRARMGETIDALAAIWFDDEEGPERAS